MNSAQVAARSAPTALPISFIAAAISVVLVVPRARADFNSCKSDLEDAVQAAGEADDAEDEYESCDHDEPGDCRDKRGELESAKDDLLRKLRIAVMTCKSAM